MLFSLLSELASGGGAGSLLGGIGSTVSGWFEPHGAPNHEYPDQEKIAAANRITRDQAGAVCALEETKVKDDFDDIVKRAANDNSYFLTLLGRYNQANPGRPIVPGNSAWLATQYTPGQQLGTSWADVYTSGDNAGLLGGALGSLPAQVNSAFPGLASVYSGIAGLPLNVNSAIPNSSSLTAQQVKDAAAAGYQGAVKGVADSLMTTDEGKAATRAGAEQFVKDNGWWLTPIGLVSLYGLGKAAKIIK